MEFSDLANSIATNWPIWAVTTFLIVGAVIDGVELRVPNWLTLPMVAAGWIYSTTCFGWDGLAWSLVGTGVGLGLLLPAYAIGGMGAGDVKMLADVGAWVYGWNTFYAFCASTIVGAVIAVIMVLCSGRIQKHYNQFMVIFTEILTLRDPEKLATIAADRKPSMMLLPYGIPIAIGTIGYFCWTGMLI